MFDFDTLVIEDIFEAALRLATRSFRRIQTPVIPVTVEVETKNLLDNLDLAAEEYDRYQEEWAIFSYGDQCREFIDLYNHFTLPVQKVPMGISALNHEIILVVPKNPLK